MRIVDTFQITGRGLVVAVESFSGLPVGKKLAATIIRPDGTSIFADAFKEWLLRREQKAETEAFLLMGLSKDDVPAGSEIELTI